MLLSPGDEDLNARGLLVALRPTDARELARAIALAGANPSLGRLATRLSLAGR